MTKGDRGIEACVVLDESSTDKMRKGRVIVDPSPQSQGCPPFPVLLVNLKTVSWVCYLRQMAHCSDLSFTDALGALG